MSYGMKIVFAQIALLFPNSTLPWQFLLQPANVKVWSINVFSLAKDLPKILYQGWQSAVVSVFVRAFKPHQRLLLFTLARIFILFAQYWLVPGTESSLIQISRVASFTIDLNQRSMSYNNCLLVTQVAKSCQQLRCLQLNQCTKVSDVGITEIAKCCPRLGRLQLDHCTRVSNQ